MNRTMIKWTSIIAGIKVYF
ncbi:hypothetical protein CGLO_13826 [Colletotrichum gloeosporioides Cg-14]|uniref:Uncharacterized protein n=1 Tax=Colletotrichum gloeosporioides (strain Cg-14) TaxID=1237896 RepID=T0L680_COLGC|nr:hypothetical protein CGLO_13826 [Colletotrichum gloeosporioides Cg-14]